MTTDSHGSPPQSITAGATRDARDPSTWSAAALAALQALLDASRVSAGEAVLATFDHPTRRLDAAAFATFWNGSRMKAMATSGPDGAPHIAPVHAEICDGRMRSTIYVNAVRRRDLRSNPRVALTTWGAHGAAAIVYGIAREMPDSVRETRSGAGGQARRTVGLEIEMTRIYAMRGRDT